MARILSLGEGEVPEKAVGEFFKVPGVSQKASGVQNHRPNNPKYVKYHG